jgi:hypothetical protein
MLTGSRDSHWLKKARYLSSESGIPAAHIIIAFLNFYLFWINTVPVDCQSFFVRKQFQEIHPIGGFKASDLSIGGISLPTD